MRKAKQYILITLASAAFVACGNRSDGQQIQQASFLSSSPEENAGYAKKQNQTNASSGLEIPARMKNVPEQILYRTGYTLSYNSTTKTPNWVAWHLTREHVNGSAHRSRDMFQEDPQVTNGPTNDDYYNSGFDRGHMCPAGDNKWNQQAMRETFYFTNMCPQVHGLNSGAWNDLEIACRNWARKYGDIYIVCGPVPQKTPIRTIGRRKVWVPQKFFKVILCMRGEGSPKAIGFIYPNASSGRKMFSYATTVDEVERQTGIDFFPRLDDKIENRVEAERGYF